MSMVSAFQLPAQQGTLTAGRQCRANPPCIASVTGSFLARLCGTCHNFGSKGGRHLFVGPHCRASVAKLVAIPLQHLVTKCHEAIGASPVCKGMAISRLKFSDPNHHQRFTWRVIVDLVGPGAD